MEDLKPIASDEMTPEQKRKAFGVPESFETVCVSKKILRAYRDIAQKAFLVTTSEGSPIQQSIRIDALAVALLRLSDEEKALVLEGLKRGA